MDFVAYQLRSNVIDLDSAQEMVLGIWEIKKHRLLRLRLRFYRNQIRLKGLQDFFIKIHKLTFAFRNMISFPEI
ncbi:hypothetical protein Avbf_05158 [Armadillidium vulgare]|nr:hypothetical protein Avbf_05158 [Armadillidium vulgare]